MMRHGMSGSEDDIKGKIYDKDLYLKLIRYLKPYWKLVTISFILLLLFAAAELALPYVTKTAVDQIVSPNTDLISFPSEAEQQNFLNKYTSIKFEAYQYNGTFFLGFSNNKLYFLDDSDIAEFKLQDRFFKKVVFLKNAKSVIDKIEGIEFLAVSEELIAVDSKRLEEFKQKGIFSSKDLQQLRYKDISRLKYYGIIFITILILQFIFTYFQIYSINFAAQHAMYDLRRDLFSHLEKMPLSFFDKNPIGRLVTRVTNDVRTMDEMLSSGLINLIQDILVMVGILVMMLVLNWRLALASFTVLPLLIFLLITFKNKVRLTYRVVRKKIAAINTTLSEDISGVKIIQLFNQYNRKKKEFTDINNEYYKASLRQMMIYASFRPAIHSLRRVSLAIIVWFGLGLVIKDMISLGIFMAFISYMDRFFQPIDHISEKFNILQAAMSGAERIFDLMENTSEDYRLEKRNGYAFKGEIEFRNVWLRYNDNGDVLKNISLRIKAGEKVALVGHTGSGKTSIISLISGLYPFQKGSILIDGKEISEYSLEELRDNIGIVQQDVFLFSGTIKDNIVLSNEDLTRDEIKQVAEYVNVDNFIESLPDKYLEPVMERGATFSVGQRQLIAFARVLAYDPAIFVLDEATSNIDTETEILIQDALKKLMENRTSIIIAHRLSTIQNVDKIIVLHKGEIKEEGTHQELLAKKGLYYDLYRLQYT
jgi:ATP-binding cassette subfamily B protein/subfamily B ATP-binding cassette protein MsbA